VSALKQVAKRAAVQAIARAAPLTWRLKRPGSLVVLMYHRVLPEDSPERRTEQPGMYVSPETLDLHLSEIKRHFDLVHLEEWLRRAKQGEALPRLSCAITLDDGWRDNFDHALPVLVRHQAPAIVFLVSSYIGRSQRFWPNRLIELILRESAHPGSVRFPDKLRKLVEPVLTQEGRASLVAEHIAPVVRRALGFDEREIRQLVEAAAQTGSRSVRDDRDMLDVPEISAMSATGLVRFGSHSATHFRLDASATEEVLIEEIVRSRTELQEICGLPIELFCYPNGVSSESSVSLVSRHYLGAVNTDMGWHASGMNPYLIRRIRLHDDISRDRAAFLARISGWL